MATGFTLDIRSCFIDIFKEKYMNLANLIKKLCVPKLRIQILDRLNNKIMALEAGKWETKFASNRPCRVFVGVVCRGSGTASVPISAIFHGVLGSHVTHKGVRSLHFAVRGSPTFFVTLWISVVLAWVQHQVAFGRQDKNREKRTSVS